MFKTQQEKLYHEAKREQERMDRESLKKFIKEHPDEVPDFLPPGSEYVMIVGVLLLFKYTGVFNYLSKYGDKVDAFLKTILA